MKGYCLEGVTQRLEYESTLGGAAESSKHMLPPGKTIPALNLGKGIKLGSVRKNFCSSELSLGNPTPQ